MYLVLLLLSTAVARKTGGRSGSFGKSGSGYGGSHGYPHSTGYTGAGGVHYPASNGLSGNNNIPKNTGTHYNTHYQQHHYSPPQQIGYGPSRYPVYHAQPPVYVYQYRNSGSRFSNLLVGLALFNLGRMSARNHNYDATRDHYGSHGEICKLGIDHGNGFYEETRIDCKLMTSFILDSDTGINHVPEHGGHGQNAVLTSDENATQTITEVGNNSVTINTTLVDATEVKGNAIEVTPDMTCHLFRVSRDTSFFKKEVDCALLQIYERNSWRSSAGRFVPFLPLFVFQIFVFNVI